MKTQNKPKYTVEQYPLVFSFASNVQGIPTITVEMLYGEDPNKDLFTGLSVVYRNLVLTIVSGGVPGCIYNVTCEVDDEVNSTAVAVLPTLAPGHSGTVVPFTELHTTPPYPGFYEDYLGLSFGPVGGSIDTLVVQGVLASDSVDLLFAPISGSLFEPGPSELAQDFIDVLFAPISGVLAAPPMGNIEDGVDLNFAPISGIIGPAPTGLVEDFVDLTFGPIGGTLGDP